MNVSRACFELKAFPCIPSALTGVSLPSLRCSCWKLTPETTSAITLLKWSHPFNVGWKKEQNFSICGAGSFAPLCFVFPACWTSCSGNNSSFITARYQLFVLRHPPLLLSLQFLNFLVCTLKILSCTLLFTTFPLLYQEFKSSVFCLLSPAHPLGLPTWLVQQTWKIHSDGKKKCWSSLKIYLNHNSMQGQHLIQFFSRKGVFRGLLQFIDTIQVPAQATFSATCSLLHIKRKENYCWNQKFSAMETLLEALHFISYSRYQVFNVCMLICDLNTTALNSCWNISKECVSNNLH